MKKTISFLGILVLFNFPFSCNPCGPFDNRPIKIVSMSSVIGSYDGNGFSEKISAQYDTATIKIQIDETKQVGLLAPTGFSFASSAYACEPVPPEVQALIGIEIISDKAVFIGGVEYKVGESLSPLFKVIYENGEYSTAEFIEEQSRNPWNFINVNSSILFLLNTKPDVSLNQKLNFIFTFDDELSYQVLTPVFTVE